MRVFKFGGASVKNADAVRNVSKVLEGYTEGPTLVVISAMGKTTNKLEELVGAYMEGNGRTKSVFSEIREFHAQIIEELMEDGNDYYEVDNLFIELECIIDKPVDPKADYDKIRRTDNTAHGRSCRFYM